MIKGVATTVLINGGSIATYGVSAGGKKYFFAGLVPQLRELRGRRVKITKMSSGYAISLVWWQKLMWWRCGP